MSYRLSQNEIVTLISRHKASKDPREKDRIKAILAQHDGYGYSEIARLLLIDDETVRRHIKDYFSKKKMTTDNKGSERFLNKIQQAELSKHLEQTTYLDSKSICAYVKATYKIRYSKSGIRQLLHALGFCYKKPHAVPAKANKAAQEDFIKAYEALKQSSQAAGESIYFMDAVHPEHQTKMAYGWIKKGERKSLPTTATQKRLHVLGAVNLDKQRVFHHCYDTINGSSVIAFLHQIRKYHKDGRRIHIILDNVSYHKSKEVKEAAKQLKFDLHYLPPYSPNLNPIERLWKMMHEQVTYNQYYQKFCEFSTAIKHFFKHIGRKKKLLRSRLTDNFQILHSPIFAY